MVKGSPEQALRTSYLKCHPSIMYRWMVAGLYVCALICVSKMYMYMYVCGICLKL